MRRVVVVGSSGSGKTTVARTLAGKLEAHYVELDALHHKPNWTEASAEELREAVHRELDGRDRWVVDGNYFGKLGEHTCLVRLWTRTVHRVHDDVELWSGNRETWRGAFGGGSRSSGGPFAITGRGGTAGRDVLPRCRT